MIIKKTDIKITYYENESDYTLDLIKNNELFMEIIGNTDLLENNKDCYWSKSKFEPEKMMNIDHHDKVKKDMVDTKFRWGLDCWDRPYIYLFFKYRDNVVCTIYQRYTDDTSRVDINGSFPFPSCAVSDSYLDYIKNDEKDNYKYNDVALFSDFLKNDSGVISRHSCIKPHELRQYKINKLY